MGGRCCHIVAGAVKGGGVYWGCCCDSGLVADVVAIGFMAFVVVIVAVVAIVIVGITPSALLVVVATLSGCCHC